MNMSATYTAFIRKQAADLGFDHCGIAHAVQLDDDARRLEKWLNKGMHGSMHYMENHFDKRIDPRKLVDNAQSVITLLLNYYPEQQQQPDAPKISKYAYGQDYHEVIRAKLNTLLARMQETMGEISGRGFVDSAPVLERSWAQRSGLGWLGKNGMIIHKQAGSFFFIATLITDLVLEYDGPVTDHCGSCTRCLDACPTGALVQPGVVDGSKCISYFTIELKEMLIPENMQGKFDNWMFGCDVCQDVCPWNRFSKPNKTPEFTPVPEILNFTTKQWEELTEEEFKKIFRQSPMKRSKYAGIRRNLRFING
ncbi:tRNA epoxyqueuosine(34) reductase QueG [Chitinophaga sp. ysch24]|uniref:Epoxyqueuosine reductase n=2 Tax=Chitinophaga tropicalis TaxID=2683588 RepID=A0A7K1UA75_9BACT|nr:tRNA epoxyqueuosine(34) reductase QueG [Chitinophaga tropicalis]